MEVDQGAGVVGKTADSPGPPGLKHIRAVEEGQQVPDDNRVNRTKE